MEYYVGLKNSLERGIIAPVYLFHGEEEYLKEKAISMFKDYLLPGAADFNLDIIDGEGTGTEISTVISLAENLPFLAEKRLVIVKKAPWFKGKGKSKVTGAKVEKQDKSDGNEELFFKYLNDPSPSTCLIFVTGDPVDRRKKLFKAIESSGRVIDFKSLKAAEMVNWVIERFKHAGKKISPPAARLLVDANGRLGLMNLYNEVEKLMTFAWDKKEVSPQDVEMVVVLNLEQNIFTVVDEAVVGNLSRALAGIRELLTLKEPPVKILTMLGRQFRLAIQAEALVKEGCPERELAGRLGVHDFVARKALGQARKSGPARLRYALEQLSSMDAAIKKGRQDFLPAIENTLINLNRIGDGNIKSIP
ncbi:DNA polymerase III subunit delta [Desulforamulus aquiferis]|uniref:DNA polymerase III subunit delta n=1 Tax=Desulforamulus aquiferis TaxID=1397668 RepID=A0AAW7ZHF3_9FIRM|nr:DNA polymerase III subunit delta [Desulforamulus aquiferis]MDO7788250.1 DNA polymerase III subunit delta [Desulforamulus aquiferis]RYD03415.1 hypothetical protein N752_19750 [Desulforamulus aquiferis]